MAEHPQVIDPLDPLVVWVHTICEGLSGVRQSKALDARTVGE